MAANLFVLALRNFERTIDGRPYGLRLRGRSTAVLVVGLMLSTAIVVSCSSTPPKSGLKVAQADVNAGLAAQQSGDLAKALKDFQSAADAYASYPVAYYDLGVIYQQQQKIPLAISEYQRALLADPNFKSALYNLAILYTPSNPNEAANLYNQLLKLNPNDIDANFNLGLLLYAQGQHTEGAAMVNKAIKLDPKLASRVPPNVNLKA